MNINKRLVSTLLISGAVCLGFSHQAISAVSLDRTRAVFNGTEKNLIVNITNDSTKKPYLAQAWLEDAKGKKLTDYFMVTPPMQRLEPSQKSVIRITSLPSVNTLPQDRESLFYFSVREVPPKSDHPNVLQLALQTKIKLFYRPASIVAERFSQHDDQLVLHKISSGYKIDNISPYYMTVLGITGKPGQAVAKNFKPVMIAPKSSVTVSSAIFPQPHVITINDFGGKPVVAYQCNGDICQPKAKKA
ncbi:fimbria/pilus periplasmic chaperone [Pantoea ananatis]|uniref:Fimbria/pilus periplasmic chaperone n=1 Tax=Pantoea ananas TaxID=553 RepID=A0A8A4KBM4_PANAN|nr:fimbria/pilus periplasmic chaperone [Pantoea ananatis]KNA29436.1 molecular chaperone [Pantoea ananatis]MBN6028873.1 fimbria/pilus periplasmic chaperone [Pantoea ananatis]MDJ0032075.1 fimbria/pilus periplasmic chaperone [Pantoea ananatis]MDJ0043310.1 fimbria/pilus periplasmic chaperone [Pantoea ananatis]PQK81323.1 molecular chaperone [Pantoea ananatis]